MKRIHKILIIIGIGILFILGIYLGWRAIISGPDEVGGPTAPDGEDVPAPPGAGVMKKLSDGPIFDFWINPATREVFYFTPDGKVMNAKDGPDLEVSTQTINALNHAEVGPNSQKVLAAFGNPKAPQWGIFDVVDGVWRPLPADIKNAAWGENNEQLIVVVQNGADLNLAKADITQTPPSYDVLVRDFRLKDVKLTYVPDNRLIISEFPSASYSASLWQVDLESLNFNLLISSEPGLSLSWSEDKALAFVFGLNSGFSVTNNNLQTEIPTPFNTLPQKCTAGSSGAYCFVPQNVPSDVVLPDDYLMKKFFSIDDLFSLDISSGEINRVLSSNTLGVPAIDAKNPQASGSKLYFINRYDNGLYELGF
jgi:hypothetical protein